MAQKQYIDWTDALHVQMLKAVITSGAHLNKRAAAGEANPWKEATKIFFSEAHICIKAIWIENELGAQRRMKDRYNAVVEKVCQTMGWKDRRVSNLSAQTSAEPGPVEALVRQILQEIEAHNAQKAEESNRQQRMSKLEASVLGTNISTSNKKTRCW